jgi:hypothetical protein
MKVSMILTGKERYDAKNAGRNQVHFLSMPVNLIKEA